MPTEFRRHLQSSFGRELFVTSVLGESALIYPLDVWADIEARLAAMPSTDRIRQRYLERVSYFGQQLKMDAQGRFVIPQLLREQAEIVGEVVVSSRLDHLEVWNRKRLQERFDKHPFGDDDFAYLSERGI